MPSHLPTTMDEAAQRLREEAFQAEPGQDFTIRGFQPEDAWGVARCFYEVYAEHYPFDTYYVPPKLIEANRQGDMISAVACTERGDIVAFGSLFRNFSQNPRLYETGQASVIPSYRGTLAVLCLQEHLFNEVGAELAIDAIFGEPVCNHRVMQRVSAVFGFVETGIELGLMPGETYRKGDAAGGRVSTLLAFKVLRDSPRELYLPREYETVLGGLLGNLPLTRNAQISTAPFPETGSSDLEVRCFAPMQALRIFACGLGRDFAKRLADELARAASQGVEVLQVMVNLGEPWAGRGVEELRRQGFFFGGLLPQWYGTDGLLMQKLAFAPDFGSLELETPASRELLAFIREDQAGLGRD
ncbi:MAG: hypothetical protein KQJ78_20470 [Deltaproteobacteria bacterium]|nr:hypothetical protein [Deltaproteobacteria bacterium]